MNIETRTFYQAPNGERWMLARAPDGHVFVIHVAPASVGGYSSEFPLDRFLMQDRGSPQLDAFLRLVGTLVEYPAMVGV